MTDERKLYKAIKSGHKEKIEDAFNDLYNKYKPLLIFISSKYLNNNEDIKDVVQESFIDFFNNINKYHQNIKGYLSTICRHNAIDVIKKSRRISYLDDEDWDNLLKDESFSHNTYNEIIDDLKHHLSELDVKIIILHIVYCYKFEEISEILKINVNSVKTLYYRALKKYKKRK